MPDAFDRAPHPALATPSSPLRDALEPWCGAGSTGVLRVLDPPCGAVYLTDGNITYAESAPACGLDRLLTASGRVPAETWRSAVAEGRPSRRVGETLVKQGVMTPVELETEVLAAIYGAGLFLLDAGADAHFEIGVEHMVGPVVALDLYAAFSELYRRRRILAETFEDSSVDDHAVVPIRRLPGHNVALTSLQWEIVAHADRRRSPVELARSLGRDTYATLLAARRLARAGLVEPGKAASTTAAPPAPPRGRAAVVTRPVEKGPWDAGPLVIGPLPHRDAHGSTPLPAMAFAEHLPPSFELSDSVLVRIRDALEAMR